MCMCLEFSHMHIESEEKKAESDKSVIASRNHNTAFIQKGQTKSNWSGKDN